MATGKRGRRDLPDISQSVDPKVREPLERLVQEMRLLLGLAGDGQDQAITKRTAVSLGIDELFNPGQPVDVVDLTPPPQVTGLGAVAGLTSVLVEWDAALYPQGGGHGQTNLYAVRLAADSPLNPTFGDAVRVYDATGALTVAALPSELNERWHIWAKWQTADGVESVDPAGGAHGIVVTTGKIGNAQIAPLAIQAAQLADGAVDLTTGKVKAATAFGALAVGYTVTQYLIANSGYMANLVVSNAQIASLSAAKLTVGDGTVGGNLKSTNYVANVSGWLAMPSGYLEANDVVVRGTVFATAGEFSAVVRMGSASNYGSGVGLWQGYDGANYVWRVGDPTGNRAQWDGAQLSIYIAGQAQPVLAAGGISAGTGTLVINTPGLSLNSAGDAVFAGMLAAATGTFAGTLSAGTVTPSAFEAIVSEFASAGTFSLTVPAKRDGWYGLAARITMQAAGGGGGGAYGTGSPNSNPIASGAGGGAGQRTVIVLESVTPGEVLSVVVGARGAGGAASQVNAGGATAASGVNGGNSTVTRVSTSTTYTANGGTGGKGGWRNGDSQHATGFAVTPAGSLGGQAGFGRNNNTGLVVDGDGNFVYTTNGAGGGYGGSSQYGAGGAAGTFWYRGASNGGDGGRGAGGGGGGVDAQHPDFAYTGAGGQGGAGYILVEFYDPYSVVTNKRYGPLIEWLDTRGFGSVPSAAR